ncbi:MAG: hypothetical protein QNJ92_14995 [Alphaproteobacteria bacterium]|nr:hypothetical protein [Alphaproteobacteria bacterium]
MIERNADKASSERRFRRIVVPLDVSPESHSALEVAAELAAALESRLEGLFIEDETLEALARLPFTRQISAVSGTPAALEPEAVSRDVRAQSERARRRLSGIAARLKVEWSFEVRRGATEAELSAQTRAGDLVALLAHRTVPRAAARHLQAALERRGPGAESAFLLPGRGRPISTGAVNVIYQPTESGARALALAERIASRLRMPLVLLLPEAKDTDRLVAQARAQLTRPLAVSAEPIPGHGLEGLVRRLCQIRQGVVIAPIEALAGHAGDLERLAAQATCPILVLRDEEPA